MEKHNPFRKLILACVLLLVLFSGIVTPGTRAATTPPVDVISMGRFHDDGDYLYAEDIQVFLDAHGSALANYYVHFPISEEDASAANIIAGAALRDNLNPTVLLTLIEVQTQLITLQPDRLSDLKYPFGKDANLPEGFAAQVWAVSERLNQDFVRYAVEGESLLVPQDAPTVMNAATWAIITHLDEDASEFAATYTMLFGDTATDDPAIRAQSVPALGLTSPYEGAYDEEITALFDHEYPTYEDGTYITLWTGENIPGATFALCKLGYNCYTGHDSYDYGIDADSNIIAAADGTVVHIGPDCAGQTVTLLHDGGYRTSYWHLHQPLVSLNQQVGRGTIIGLSGGDQGGCSTGAHLHFNVTFLNEDTDPFGWEGDYTEPCVVNDTCAPGQFLWSTTEITATATPTPTPPPTPIGTPTPTPTAHPDGDSYEPDGDYPMANPITSFQAQEHSIMPAGDHDWVTFTLSQYSAVNIWTNGLSDADTEMRLYDSSLKELDFNDDFTSDNEYSRIARICEMNPLPPGQYYIEVTEAGSMNPIDSYMLEFIAFVCTGYATPPPPEVVPWVYVPLINANGGEVIIVSKPGQ